MEREIEIRGERGGGEINGKRNTYDIEIYGKRKGQRV